MEHLSFLTAAMKDRNVGAICPTSGMSVRRICSRIPKDRPVVVVEYGPGTGVFTKHLVKTLHPESTVLAVELNRIFAGRLRRYSKTRKIKTPRLIVARDDARNVLKLLKKHGHQHADYVISGIPFSLIDEVSKRQIIERTFEALGPEGWFSVYQYTYHVRRYLVESFDEVQLGRSLFNIPPLCVMEAKKAARAAVPASFTDELLAQSAEAPLLVDVQHDEFAFNRPALGNGSLGQV